MIAAKESPRFENDILYWYYQNTWELELTINLTGDLGPVTMGKDDIVKMVFKRSSSSPSLFKEYVFTNIENNTVKLIMDKQTSDEFVPGEYVLGITYYGEGVSTIVAGSKVIVENVII